jgi:hypothetical protein
MQYLIPNSGSIKDALYIFQNGWDFLDATSINYMTTGGWIDAAGDNKWTNVKCISGDTFTGVQLYINQGGIVTTPGATGLADMLLKVRDNGTDVNSQSYTVYSRPAQCKYSSFTTTSSAGGVDTIPLSKSADALLTESDEDLAAYSDLSITWGTIKRSAFDGAAATKYTLDGELADDATTVTVNEAIDAGVPSTGAIQIENEVITYTGKGTKTFTGCTRGAYSTTAAVHASGKSVSTNTKQYDILVKTTSSSRTLVEIYNWIQYQLRQTGDIDAGAGTHLGYITDELVSMASSTAMITKTGVWIEGFSATDANYITYTDHDAATHDAPLSVPVVVNVDGTGYQVAVFALDNTGYTDATYTPAKISSTIINETSASTAVSTSITYTADVPVRIVVRKAGYQQFSLYTTITSAGLNATSINGADSAY